MRPRRRDEQVVRSGRRHQLPLQLPLQDLSLDGDTRLFASPHRPGDRDRPLGGHPLANLVGRVMRQVDRPEMPARLDPAELRRVYHVQDADPPSVRLRGVDRKTQGQVERGAVEDGKEDMQLSAPFHNYGNVW